MDGREDTVACIGRLHGYRSIGRIADFVVQDNVRIGTQRCHQNLLGSQVQGFIGCLAHLYLGKIIFIDLDWFSNLDDIQWLLHAVQDVMNLGMKTGRLACAGRPGIKEHACSIPVEDGFDGIQVFRDVADGVQCFLGTLRSPCLRQEAQIDFFLSIGTDWQRLQADEDVLTAAMQVERAFIRHVRAHDIDVTRIIHQLDEIRDILHLAGRKEVVMRDIHHMACNTETDLEAIEGWQHMDIRAF